MKHAVITKAQLKAESEALKIPFPNLLAGYLLEELLYLITESEYGACLWLKNEGILGVEQYRKRENSLTLDFAYALNPRVMEKGELRPGQKISLKLAYLMLLQFLEKEKTPKIKWKGKAVLKENGAEFEIMGEFEEMTVPLRVCLTEILVEDNFMPAPKEMVPFMAPGEEISYLKYPGELFLTEQLGVVLKQMELIPDMDSYSQIYRILSENSMDGRHVKEELQQLCERERISMEEDRVQELVSYREYSYMRKRWEKYLRHCGKTEPKWEEVVDKLEKFLSPIWQAVCKDEVFFGDWMPDLGRFLD